MFFRGLCRDQPVHQASRDVFERRGIRRASELPDCASRGRRDPQGLWRNSEGAVIPHQIFMLTVYGKGVKEDLRSADLKVVARMLMEMTSD